MPARASAFPKVRRARLSFAAASRSGIVALSQAGYDLSSAAKELEEDYRRFID